MCIRDREQATAIALEHAGVTQEETALYRVKADWEDGQPVYEVEFAVGTTEYDYTIAQETGKILSYDSDVEGWAPVAGESQAPGRAAESITLEQATQLVLERIPGASASDVRIYQEQDDGRTVYEGEALSLIHIWSKRPSHWQPFPLCYPAKVPLKITPALQAGPLRQPRWNTQPPLREPGQRPRLQRPSAPPAKRGWTGIHDGVQSRFR